MNILDSTTPASLRDDIVKYLTWIATNERRMAIGGKTQRARSACSHAAATIEDAIKEISGARLMPLTRVNFAIHHKDGDPTNNDPENLEVVDCG